MDRDPFEVTVQGGGDPETFVAKEVEIVVNGRRHFTITPGTYGLIIQSSSEPPLFLSGTKVDRETVKVEVCKTGD